MSKVDIQCSVKGCKKRRKWGDTAQRSDSEIDEDETPMKNKYPRSFHG